MANTLKYNINNFSVIFSTLDGAGQKYRTLKVEEFYNQISREYTGLLERTIPRYREMLSMMFYYLPVGYNPRKILELGCGTGNLTELIVKSYPDSHIITVDFSAEILKECQLRFEDKTNIEYYHQDFRILTFLESSFDLIISSIAIHHLKDDEKRLLFARLYSFLKPNGILLFADQCRGETQAIYAKHMECWREEAFRLGSTAEDWKLWMRHQENHDYHSTVKEHIQWLTNARFSNIDVIWKYLLWTVFYSEKPQ